MKVLKIICFSLMAVIELIVIIAVVGTAADSPLEPLSFVLSNSLGFGLLLLLSIGGIVRTVTNKKLCFICPLVMKLFISLLTLGGWTLSFGDCTVNWLTLLFFGAALPVGIAAYHMGRYSDRHSPKNVPVSFPGMLRFLGDKAEFYWEAVVDEYYRGTPPADFTDEETQRIYGYASLHIACFMCWLLRRGKAGEELITSVPADVLEELKNGMGDPRDMLSYTDYTFTPGMVDESMHGFCALYYDSDRPKFGRVNMRNSNSLGYMFDFFEIFGGGQYMYINDFSREKQEKLEECLDRRYRGTVLDIRDDKSIGTLPANELDWKDVNILRTADATDEDVRICAVDIYKISEQRKNDLLLRFTEHLQNVGCTVPDDPKEIFGIFTPLNMCVYPSLDGYKPVYTLDLYGDGEPIGDNSLTVIGDNVLKMVDIDDGIIPYTDVAECVLKRLLCDPKDVREVCITPYEFGGEQTFENSITLPAYAADFKEKCDRRLICLKKQGYEFEYACRPDIDDGILKRLAVYAKLTDGNTLFYDMIGIDKAPTKEIV